ncbi:hypothetical protein V498_09819 [Pseudogymnoascus sp. VKM F-4517 (FW-2822)]|nr:hypothetical protein V498_09819 [Pseudogymnoascus sp. VKM F-4517 (FW-2822)]
MVDGSLIVASIPRLDLHLLDLLADRACGIAPDTCYSPGLNAKDECQRAERQRAERQRRDFRIYEVVEDSEGSRSEHEEGSVDMVPDSQYSSDQRNQIGEHRGVGSQDNSDQRNQIGERRGTRGNRLIDDESYHQFPEALIYRFYVLYLVDESVRCGKTEGSGENGWQRKKAAMTTYGPGGRENKQRQEERGPAGRGIDENTEVTQPEPLATKTQ